MTSLEEWIDNSLATADQEASSEASSSSEGDFSVDLQCEDSEYEVSSDDNGSSIDGDDGETEIRPYRFEPEAPESDNEEPADVRPTQANHFMPVDIGRLQNTEW